MFSKLKQNISGHLSSNRLMLLRSGLAVLLLLGIFIAYKAWQEYQVYVVNKNIEIFPTAAGGEEGWVISWEDHSDNEDGFVIEVKQNDTFELVATLAADETSYTETNQETGKTYCYRVGAFNASGTNYSDEACFTAAESDPDTPQFSMLQNIDMYDSKKIDVSNIKYFTSQGEQGNTDLSEGNVVKLFYEGNSRSRTRTYSFIDNGEVVARGNTVFGWREKNAVLIDLQSYSDQTVIASLFLRALVEDVDSAQIQLIINDDINLIELTEGGTWFSIRADIEYSGDVSIEIRPVGNINSEVGKGSKIRFGGITLQ